MRRINGLFSANLRRIETVISARRVERGDLFKFPPYKSLQQEREEIGEGVEVSVEADVLAAELYPVFYFWVFAVSSCKFGERLSGIVLSLIHI